ncbi:macro domain-containing protein [European chub iridovirus]|nr:macro domain-containing protein [European chub iridovirus]
MFSIFEIGDILVIGREGGNAVFMHDRNNENYISVRESTLFRCKDLCVEIYDIVGNDPEKLKRCFIAAAQVYGSKLVANMNTVNIDPEWVYEGFVNIQDNMIGFCPAHFCVEHQKNTQEIARMILTMGTGAQPVNIDVRTSLLQVLRLREMLQFHDVRQGKMYVFNTYDNKYDIVTCISMPDYADIELLADSSFRYYVDGTTDVVPDQFDVSDGLIGYVYVNRLGVCFFTHSNDGQTYATDIILWDALNNLDTISFDVWYVPNVNEQPIIPSVMFDLNRKLPSIVKKHNKSQDDMNNMPLSSVINRNDNFDEEDDDDSFDNTSYGYDSVEDEDDSVSVAYDSVTDNVVSVGYDSVADDSVSVAYDSVASEATERRLPNRPLPPDPLRNPHNTTVTDVLRMRRHAIAPDSETGSVVSDVQQPVGFRAVSNNTPSNRQMGGAVRHLLDEPLYANMITILMGDITHISCDAIVNAANTSLLGGTGVDGAIHAAAGPALLAETRTLGGARTGQAKITRGYNLPARYVIHTVGPIVPQGLRPSAQHIRDLSNCYINSLDVARQNNLRTVVFPSISTGVYNFPIDIAVDIALSSVRQYLDNNNAWGVFDRIAFCLFSQRDYNLYRNRLAHHF